MQTDIQTVAQRLGVALDEAQTSLFHRFRDRLAQSANEFNLTAVRDPELIEKRHFIEAIAFGAVLDERNLLPPGTRVLDIGSGAGLPGLPLKLAWPHLDVTLLEATGKKCRFLEQMADELGLDGVSVIEGRAEEIAHRPDQRGAYDLVVARAVAPLPVLLEYSLPFVRTGGHFAANKGSAAERELEESDAALRELGGLLEVTLPFYPPEVIGQTIIVVRKTGETPARYPRRIGIPTKRPLV